jgi:hypothetical protein
MLILSVLLFAAVTPRLCYGGFSTLYIFSLCPLDTYSLFAHSLLMLYLLTQCLFSVYTPNTYFLFAHSMLILCLSLDKSRILSSLRSFVKRVGVWPLNACSLLAHSLHILYLSNRCVFSVCPLDKSRILFSLRSFVKRVGVWPLDAYPLFAHAMLMLC